MKILIISDIHGDYEACKKVLQNEADKIIILGDLLKTSLGNPKMSISKEGEHISTLLNRYASQIIAVKGNCDTYGDDDLFDFDTTKDYRVLEIDGLKFYLTHGNYYNKYDLPPIEKGSVLLQGHTHIADLSIEEGIYCVNPGSISLPRKGDTTYCIYEDNCFKIFELNENKSIKEMKIKKGRKY